jgi:four helix bundle protein
MEKYQSLEAWKCAHASLLLVLRATDVAYHPRSRALFDQIRRATISIEANIVEGYALSTPAYFRKHLRIAIGSAAEAECLVRTAGEVNYLAEARCAEVLELLGRTMRLLRGLLMKPLVLRAPSGTTPHSQLP